MARRKKNSVFEVWHVVGGEMKKSYAEGNSGLIVAAEFKDVESIGKVTECAECRQERPTALISNKPMCGYCKVKYEGWDAE